MKINIPRLSLFIFSLALFEILKQEDVSSIELEDTNDSHLSEILNQASSLGINLPADLIDKRKTQDKFEKKVLRQNKEINELFKSQQLAKEMLDSQFKEIQQICEDSEIEKAKIFSIFENQQKSFEDTFNEKIAKIENYFKSFNITEENLKDLETYQNLQKDKEIAEWKYVQLQNELEEELENALIEELLKLREFTLNTDSKFFVDLTRKDNEIEDKLNSDNFDKKVFYFEKEVLNKDKVAMIGLKELNESEPIDEFDFIEDKNKKQQEQTKKENRYPDPGLISEDTKIKKDDDIDTSILELFNTTEAESEVKDDEVKNENPIDIPKNHNTDNILDLFKEKDDFQGKKLSQNSRLNNTEVPIYDISNNNEKALESEIPVKKAGDSFEFLFKNNELIPPNDIKTQDNYIDFFNSHDEITEDSPIIKIENDLSPIFKNNDQTPLEKTLEPIKNLFIDNEQNPIKVNPSGNTEEMFLDIFNNNDQIQKIEVSSQMNLDNIFNLPDKKDLPIFDLFNINDEISNEEIDKPLKDLKNNDEFRPTKIPITNSTELPLNSPIEIPLNSPRDIPLSNPTDIPLNNSTDIPLNSPIEIPLSNPTDIPLNNPTDLQPLNSSTEISLKNEDIINQSKNPSTYSNKIHHMNAGVDELNNAEELNMVEIKNPLNTKNAFNDTILNFPENENSVDSDPGSQEKLDTLEEPNPSNIIYTEKNKSLEINISNNKDTPNNNDLIKDTPTPNSSSSQTNSSDVPKVDKKKPIDNITNEINNIKNPQNLFDVLPESSPPNPETNDEKINPKDIVFINSKPEIIIPMKHLNSSNPNKPENKYKETDLVDEQTKILNKEKNINSFHPNIKNNKNVKNTTTQIIIKPSPASRNVNPVMKKSFNEKPIKSKEKILIEPSQTLNSVIKQKLTNSYTPNPQYSTNRTFLIKPLTSKTTLNSYNSKPVSSTKSSNSNKPLTSITKNSYNIKPISSTSTISIKPLTTTTSNLDIPKPQSSKKTISINPSTKTTSNSYIVKPIIKTNNNLGTKNLILSNYINPKSVTKSNSLNVSSSLNMQMMNNLIPNKKNEKNTQAPNNLKKSNVFDFNNFDPNS